MDEDHLSIERRIATHRPLAPLTTLGVGGCAEYYLLAESVGDVIEACKWAEERRLSIRVLSGGSNLVVADEGVSGLILDIRLKGVNYWSHAGSTLVTAAAGVNWDELVATLVERGLWGVECLSGIPGRVGATPIQNVGAYGQEVAQSITTVEAYDRVTRELISIPNDGCAFGYRTSRFRMADRERFIILSVCFALHREPMNRTTHVELSRHLNAETATASQTRDAVLALRRAKSMVFDAADPWSRSCGSFFVNPVVPAAVAERIRLLVAPAQVPIYPVSGEQVKIAAAWLIEQAGFARGFRDGPVGLSHRHTLAIVAHPTAAASDVCRLARLIQQTVLERFGVELMPEPAFWGFSAFERGLPAPSLQG